MNALEMTQEFTVTASVGAAEYQIKVRDHHHGGHWVSMFVWHGKPVSAGYWACVFAPTHISHPENSMDSIREAFRTVWGRLRHLARTRQQFMALAAAERGGKRGYYSRLANDTAKQILQEAQVWRICKAVWKEITKL